MELSTPIYKPLEPLLHFLFERFVRPFDLLNVLVEMMVCLPHLSVDHEQSVPCHAVSLMQKTLKSLESFFLVLVQFLESVVDACMLFLKVCVDLKQLFFDVAHTEGLGLFVRLVDFKLELEQWV